MAPFYEWRVRGNVENGEHKPLISPSRLMIDKIDSIHLVAMANCQILFLCWRIIQRELPLSL